MRILMVTEELLTLNECVLDIDRGKTSKTATCRLATDAEKHTIDAIHTKDMVCALGEDGKLLLELGPGGMWYIPILRKGGKQPRWQDSIIRPFDTDIIDATGLPGRNMPQSIEVIKVRAHGHIGDWQYKYAWFY